MRIRDHFTAAVGRCASTGAGARLAIGIIVTAAVGCFWLLPQTANAAQDLTLTLSASSIPDDGTTASTASVSVIDSTTNTPVPNEVINFTADSGLSANFSNGATCTTGTSGGCSVQVTSQTPSAGNVTATDATGPLSPYNGEAASQPLSVTFGPPAHLSLTLNPSTITANGSSPSTATARVTDGSGNPLQGETVSFTDDAGAPVTFSPASSCATDATGSCSVSITGNTAGSTTITATDSAGSSPAQSKTLRETAPLPAHVALVVSPSTILADGLSTTTAIATVHDAANNPVVGAAVTFKSTDLHQSIGGVTDNGDGTYTVQIRSSTTIGTSTITAKAGAVSQTASLIQAAGPSTTSLAASSSSLVTNQAVALVATVTSGTGAPTGTITFQNGGVTIPGCGGEPVSPSSPIATCQTTFPASASPAQLTAVFAPGPGSTAPGSTGSLTLSIGKDSTSLALQAPSSATTGRAITYTAQVSPPPARPGPVAPSGTVRFSDGGQVISTCASQPVVNGSAVCTVSYAKAGSHAITAQYDGDTNFSGSNAAPTDVRVVVLRIPIVGNLADTMQWDFHFTPRYTKVRQLIVIGASPGDIIRVTCHGRGCPFAKRTMRLAARKHCTVKHGKRTCVTQRGKTNVIVPIQGRRLSSGVMVTVSITRPNWIGKYYAFIMRTRRGPRIRISCLTPGYSTPGVGCST